MQGQQNVNKNVKYVHAQEARMTYAYKNTKEKLPMTYAAVLFKKITLSIN